ncbi:MAG: glycosyltransferase family A protein [Legionellaceae bacterium]|nr:glycosyltransferase family A protein [Legionellaceae bacterium]
MKILKKSQLQKPKISLILLDWSVRESFHLLYYLSKQTLPQDQFEVIIVEYYSTVSPAIKKFEDQVDTWALLEMPEEAYYHKHLMYNAGLALSKGELIIICDSDAMAKPTFLQSVVDSFKQDPNIVLHIDQFRNNRQELYPFNYPTFDEVTGRGCGNYDNGLTTGLAVKNDLIHNRNYGACFCAKREDLITIGGADEHIDFIGHICGPYDLTFRLLNLDRKEVWHESEFLYHTWHPGQAGDDNYLGPHDGRHVSTTALDALYDIRSEPHVINPVIEMERQGFEITDQILDEKLILPVYEKITARSFLESKESRKWANQTYKDVIYNGFYIVHKDDYYYAVPKLFYTKNKDGDLDQISSYKYASLSKVKAKIDNYFSIKVKIVPQVVMFYVLCARIWYGIKKVQRLSANRRQNRELSNKNEKGKVVESKESPIRFSTFRKLISRLRLPKEESAYLWRNVKSLFVSIQEYCKMDHEPMTIIMSNSSYEKTILYIAVKLKLVPKIQIIQVRNQLEVENIMGTLSEDANEKAPILLGRQAYIEYLTYFKDSVKKKDVFVI